MNTDPRADEALLPPRTRTEAGGLRRVGVEIELAGLDPGVMLAAIVDQFGGNAREVSSFCHAVRGARHGDFLVELDSEPVQSLGDRLDPDSGEDTAADTGVAPLALRTLASVAGVLMPWEVVTPPLPMSALVELAPLVAALRASGARGTAHSARYAFGLHFNPEMPDLRTATIVAYLKAYLCLEPWLRREEEVNLTRRLTPYVRAFPDAYATLVLAPDYAPADAGILLDDYLRFNRTRNRSLDLLPLFAELDASRLARGIDDPRIKARPALHYRLPNCDIDNPRWSVAQPWRRWLQVEYLAASAAALEEASLAALAWRRREGGSEPSPMAGIERFLLAPR